MGNGLYWNHRGANALRMVQSNLVVVLTLSLELATNTAPSLKCGLKGVVMVIYRLGVSAGGKWLIIWIIL